MLSPVVVSAGLAYPLGLSRRDREILTLTRRLLANPRANFATTLGALREATERLIPAGRIFHLGQRAGRPIIGSLVSGVGLVDVSGVIHIARVEHGDVVMLGSWSP